MLLGTDIEDEPMESQHKNTDDQKYFKIAHEGQTFLVKVQRANLATGETETKSQSLNNSLVILIFSLFISPCYIFKFLFNNY